MPVDVGGTTHYALPALVVLGSDDDPLAGAPVTVTDLAGAAVTVLDLDTQLPITLTTTSRGVVRSCLAPLLTVRYDAGEGPFVVSSSDVADLAQSADTAAAAATAAATAATAALDAALVDTRVRSNPDGTWTNPLGEDTERPYATPFEHVADVSATTVQVPPWPLVNNDGLTYHAGQSFAGLP